MSYNKIKTFFSWGKDKGSRVENTVTPTAPFKQAFMKVLKPIEIQRLLQIGLRPKEITLISINQMYLQFRNEWPIHGYNSNPRCRVPMPITTSPLFEFLESYKKHGKKALSGRLYKESSYYKMWKSINQVGFKYDWYNYPNTIAKSFSDGVIRSKMKDLINVFESILKYGYRKERFEKSIIMVLTEPFENTRFGFEHSMDGYEIWSGHHRAAALAALDIENAEVLILEDKQRQSQ